MFWLIVTAILAYIAYKYLYDTLAPVGETASRSLDTSQPKTILPTVPPPTVPETLTLSPRDQIAMTVESLNWCNDITAICWPYIGAITETMLGPTVEPLINLSLPKPFKDFQFVSKDLGRDPLKVDRITVHRRHHNSIAIDVDVSFVGSPDLQMRCTPLAGTFGIRELRWSGRLHVLLRPLIPTMPLVGAVQMAMVTHPELDIDFTGVADVADFGPVSKIVRKVLRQVIASMIVLPNRMVFKLSEAVDFFDVYYPPLGAMEVVLCKGRGFQKERKVGFIKTVPDVFVKAKFGLEKFRTPHVRNSLTPVWNVSHTFIVYDLDQPLDMKVMDKDTMRHDILGEITLLARELLAEQQQWVRPRENVNQTVARDAEILIETNFHVFSPKGAPLSPSKCMVSVLVDRASKLPVDSSSTMCKVHIGKSVVRQTDSVIKMDDPIPGYTPVHPMWCKSFDVLCDHPDDTTVVFEVYDKKRKLGTHTITSTELRAAENMRVEGVFSIGGGATLRAKVILHGLVKDKAGMGLTR